MAFTFNLPVNTGYMSNVKCATRGLHHEGEFMSKVTLTFWNKKLEDLRPRTKSQEMCSVKIKYSQEEENILLNNQRHEYHPLTIQYHFDSEDDYRSGCRNVSHCHQQFFSELHSPGRSQ